MDKTPREMIASTLRNEFGLNRTNEVEMRNTFTECNLIRALGKRRSVEDVACFLAQSTAVNSGFRELSLFILSPN
jgi:hypothetical protein